MAKRINQAQREAEILDMMKRNGYTREEAVELWEWDNSDEETEETEKAKQGWKEMSRTAHDARTIKNPGEKKEKQVKNRAPNEDKRMLIEILRKALESVPDIENVQVTNIEKYIAFNLHGWSFDINLVRHNKPKEKGKA